MDCPVSPLFELSDHSARQWIGGGESAVGADFYAAIATNTLGIIDLDSVGQGGNGFGRTLFSADTAYPAERPCCRSLEQVPPHQSLDRFGTETRGTQLGEPETSNRRGITRERGWGGEKPQGHGCLVGGQRFGRASHQTGNGEIEG